MFHTRTSLTYLCMIHRSWGLSGSLVESQIQVLDVIVNLPADLASLVGGGQWPSLEVDMLP
jgi:hypothetical protein